MQGWSERDAHVCLNFYLSAEGRRVGGSINHSQSFIFSGSYHFTTIGEWVGVGSFAWGRVTVEKLSGGKENVWLRPCVRLVSFCFFVFFWSLGKRAG